MTRTRWSIAAALLLALLAWSGRPEVLRVASAQPPRPPRVACEYKAMTRLDLENLTPANPDEAKDAKAITDVISGMSLPRLTRGLNALGAEGWELVAIEPFHTAPPVGVSAGATLNYPVTYLFRRAK